MLEAVAQCCPTLLMRVNSKSKRLSRHFLRRQSLNSTINRNVRPNLHRVEIAKTRLNIWEWGGEGRTLAAFNPI